MLSLPIAVLVFYLVGLGYSYLVSLQATKSKKSNKNKKMRVFSAKKRKKRE